MKRAYVKNQGFTIVELLIVIVVIGVLAAISIVVYGDIKDRATDARLESESAAVLKGAKMRLAESGNLDLPPSVDSANALANYLYYQSLGDKVLTTAYDWSTDTAVIGSYDEASEQYPDKTKLSVKYGVYSNGVSLRTVRWNHLESKYEISVLSVEPGGHTHEWSDSYIDCTLKPDHTGCQEA